MLRKTTVRSIGNHAGIVIPRAMLDHYHLQEGDPVYLVEDEDSILITPLDPGDAEALKVYRQGAERYRDAMRELAE